MIHAYSLFLVLNETNLAESAKIIRFSVRFSDK